MLLFLALLSTLYLTPHSANILTTTSIPGSHFFLTKQISELLAEHGHNVTFISAAEESRVQVHPDLHYIQPTSNVGFYPMDKYFDVIEPFLAVAMRNTVDSEDMAAVLMLHKDSWECNVNITEEGLHFFTSQQLQEILNSTKFDLIIAEETSLLAVSTVTYRSNTPIIVLNSMSDMRFVRSRLALPFLMSSEPGFIGPVPAVRIPTFQDRLHALLTITQMFSTWIKYLSGELLDKVFLPAGVQDLAQLNENIVLTFTNDHPAVSFPYLAPPNTVYLGGLHLTEHSQLQPLTGRLDQFIGACSQPDVIYVSFGTYLRDLNKVPWLGRFLEYLENLDACVIFRAKGGINTASLNKDKFLILPWVPQKDLLGSGKLTLFISHCGQNGRLEAIYYNVPILCIPLFGDQLLNAYYIQRNGLGGMLFKEHLSKESLSRVTSNIIENREEIVSNQAKAAHVMRNEPGVGKEAVLFYVNLLTEHGNLDYLRNRVIEKQWTYEIYNIDVMVIIMMLGLVLIGIGIKCLVFLVRVGIRMKTKS